MNEVEYPKFKYRLRELRASTGLSNVQFGKLFGVSGPSICRWENGACYPNQRQMKQICEYFNISLDYLFGVSDEKGVIIKNEPLENNRELLYVGNLSHEQIESLKKIIELYEKTK